MQLLAVYKDSHGSSWGVTAHGVCHRYLMDGETEDSNRTGLSLLHKADSARQWGPVSSSCSVPAGAPFGVSLQSAEELRACLFN